MVNLDENTNRKVNNLLDRVGISGPPYVQASLPTTLQAYYNSQFIDTRGDLGILIDVGRIHRIACHAAVRLQHCRSWRDIQRPHTWQLYDLDGEQRLGGEDRRQQAISRRFFDVHAARCQLWHDRSRYGCHDGQTYLFGDATQPPEVTDDDPVDVTEDDVFALYIFLRDLEPIETDPSDGNTVGLSEIQFFGFSLGDVNLVAPSTCSRGTLY